MNEFMAAMRTRSTRALGYLAVAASLCIATGAYGQSRDRDIDVERRSRPSTNSDTERPSARSGFEVVLTAPVLYTNFAVQTVTEELVSRQGDWHFNPDLLLKWSHQYDWVKLTLGADVMVDRYLTQSAADEDTLIGTAKVAFTDGKSDLFVPYVSYSGSMDFQPLFGQRDDTLQDFAAGFSSGIGLRSGSIIPYGKANSSGDAYVRFDARVGRRVADPRDFENTFVVTTLQVGYFAGKDWELSVTPGFRARWYDDYFGDFRRDLKPSVVLLAAWTPEWLRKALPRSEIDFSAELERNLSNLPEKTYTRWEAGPTVILKAKF